MIVPLKGMTRYQGEPTHGTLRVEYLSRLEDGQGNASPGVFDYYASAADLAAGIWRDEHNRASAASLVVNDLGVRGTHLRFTETFFYSDRPAIENTYLRNSTPTNLEGTEYDYTEAQAVQLVGPSGVPLTWQAAQEFIGSGGTLLTDISTGLGLLDTALADIEQSKEAIAATANSVPYANLAAFPASSTATKGAIALDTGNVYAPGGATWGNPIGTVPTGAAVVAIDTKATAAQAQASAIKSALTLATVAALSGFAGDLTTATVADPIRGGQFVRALKSVAGQPDGGTRFAHDDPAYVWQRLYSGFASITWWDTRPDQVMPKDNGPAINEAIQAMGPRGVLSIPAGLTYGVYTPVVAPFTFTFVGADRNSSQFRPMDQSGDYFQVRSEGGVTFLNLGFIPPSPSTKMVAGSRIISLRGSAPGKMNAGSRVRNCSFLSHACAVDAISAFGYVVSDNNFNDLQSNGSSVKLDNIGNPDYGDGVIERNNFHSDFASLNTRAIQQLAGGGIRIHNNKFYWHTIAYNLFLLHGAGTSIGWIQSNSFETQSKSAVLLEYDKSLIPAWSAGLNAVEQNTTVRPTVPNGYIYRAATSGVTGGTQPTWPTVQEATVIDGGVTWVAALDAQFYAKFHIVLNQMNEDSEANIRVDGGLVIKYVHIFGNQHTMADSTVGVDLISGVRVVVDGCDLVRDAGSPGGVGIRVGPEVLFPSIGVNHFNNLATNIDDLTGKLPNLLKPFPLETGWSTAAGADPARMIKRTAANGATVHLSGSIGGGSVAGGTVFGVLPVGFRPANKHRFVAFVLNGDLKTVFVEVRSTGEVAITVTPLGAATADELSLSGISFPVA